jgi:hypothetical protein
VRNVALTDIPDAREAHALDQLLAAVDDIATVRSAMVRRCWRAAPALRWECVVEDLRG